MNKNDERAMVKFDDHPKSKDYYEEQRFLQEFTEISRCLECGGEVDQHFSGDEGWGICNDCGTIEGDTETIYQCSLCEEESENEECNCYKK